jgi:hypothetical protein
MSVSTQLRPQEVRDAVLHDIDKHARVCHPDDFVGTLLPQLHGVNWTEVLEDLVAHGWYCEGEHPQWKAIPRSSTIEEREYYAPVADVANAIIHHASKQVQAAPLRPRWIDRHSGVPISTCGQEAPGIRPDLNCFLVPSDEDPAFNFEEQVRYDISHVYTP